MPTPVSAPANNNIMAADADASSPHSSSASSEQSSDLLNSQPDSPQQPNTAVAAAAAPPAMRPSEDYTNICEKSHASIREGKAPAGQNNNRTSNFSNMADCNSERKRPHNNDTDQKFDTDNVGDDDIKASSSSPRREMRLYDKNKNYGSKKVHAVHAAITSNDQPTPPKKEGSSSKKSSNSKKVVVQKERRLTTMFNRANEKRNEEEEEEEEEAVKNDKPSSPKSTDNTSPKSKFTLGLELSPIAKQGLHNNTKHSPHSNSSDDSSKTTPLPPELNVHAPEKFRASYESKNTHSEKNTANINAIVANQEAALNLSREEIEVPAPPIGNVNVEEKDEYGEYGGGVSQLTQTQALPPPWEGQTQKEELDDMGDDDVDDDVDDNEVEKKDDERGDTKLGGDNVNHNDDGDDVQFDNDGVDIGNVLDDFQKLEKEMEEMAAAAAAAAKVTEKQNVEGVAPRGDQQKEDKVTAPLRISEYQRAIGAGPDRENDKNENSTEQQLKKPASKVAPNISKKAATDAQPPAAKKRKAKKALAMALEAENEPEPDVEEDADDQKKNSKKRKANNNPTALALVVYDETGEVDSYMNNASAKVKRQGKMLAWKESSFHDDDEEEEEDQGHTSVNFDEDDVKQSEPLLGTETQKPLSEPLLGTETQQQSQPLLGTETQKQSEPLLGETEMHSEPLLEETEMQSSEPLLGETELQSQPLLGTETQMQSKPLLTEPLEPPESKATTKEKLQKLGIKAPPEDFIQARNELILALRDELEAMQRTLTCCICQGTLKKSVILPCGHALCGSPCKKNMFNPRPPPKKKGEKQSPPRTYHECPHCKAHLPRRAGEECPQLDELAKCYKRMERAFFFAPAKHSNDVNHMTQIDPDEVDSDDEDSDEDSDDGRKMNIHDLQQHVQGAKAVQEAFSSHPKYQWQAKKQEIIVRVNKAALNRKMIQLGMDEETEVVKERETTHDGISSTLDRKKDAEIENNSNTAEETNAESLTAGHEKLKTAEEVDAKDESTLEEEEFCTAPDGTQYSTGRESQSTSGSTVYHDGHTAKKANRPAEMTCKLRDGTDVNNLEQSPESLSRMRESTATAASSSSSPIVLHDGNTVKKKPASKRRLPSLPGSNVDDDPTPRRSGAMDALDAAVAVEHGAATKDIDLNSETDSVGRGATLPEPKVEALEAASSKEAVADSVAPASDRKADKKEEAITKGTIVMIQARTWPGINKPGGVARVQKVHCGGNSTKYDVKYVLGGSEKKVDEAFVTPHNELSTIEECADESMMTSGSISPEKKRHMRQRRAAVKTEPVAAVVPIYRDSELEQIPSDVLQWAGIKPKKGGKSKKATPSKKEAGRGKKRALKDSNTKPKSKPAKKQKAASKKVESSLEEEKNEQSTSLDEVLSELSTEEIVSLADARYSSLLSLDKKQSESNTAQTLFAVTSSLSDEQSKTLDSLCKLLKEKSGEYPFILMALVFCHAFSNPTPVCLHLHLL